MQSQSNEVRSGRGARMIVDGHLDIGFSALLGRDFLKSADEIRSTEAAGLPRGIATLGLPYLLRANERVVFGTILAGPCKDKLEPDEPCYETLEEARAIAQRQLQYYQNLNRTTQVRLIRTRAELDKIVAAEPPQLGIVLLMEGAEPLLAPEEVAGWFREGLRIVGPAWHGTRYAGGTGAPGPLTVLGRRLLGQMESLRVILDLSHLAEASFFEAIDSYRGPVIASHSNCRTIVPTDRQLSDEMIRAIVRRDGVIGIVLANHFLQAGWKESGQVKAQVTLRHVVAQIEHMCDLAGDSRHVAIGSDFDGGFGAESIPAELDHVEDLHKLEDALVQADFSEDDVNNVMSGNWLRVLRRSLPD